MFVRIGFAIITGFPCVHDIVPTSRQTAIHSASVRLIIGIILAVVAGFDAHVDLTVSALGENASDKTAVSVAVVAIITPLPRVGDPVAAGRRGAVESAGIGGQITVRIAFITLFFTNEEKAIAARRHLAGGKTLVTIASVAIVAGLVLLLNAITTAGELAAIRAGKPSN